MNVAVIGCGSAGPAAAALLARAGNQVTLLEEVEALGPVGAGLLLQPTGLEVLSRVGALAPVLDHGATVDRLRSVTAGGATLLDLRYAELVPGLRGVGVHRAVLLHYLVEAARDAGASVELGCSVAAIERDGDRALVTLASGGERGPFDLVVAADGARSALREASAVRGSARPYPWGALWLIGIDPVECGSGELFQVVRSARQMLGLLPTGMDLDGADDPLVSLFWSVPVESIPAIRAAGLDALRAAIESMTDRAGPLLDAIDSVDAFTTAEYLDVRMPRWHDGPVVFIGDAAHAMSPQLGQGVNLALCDAAGLADAVAATSSVPEALAAYQRARARHVRYYQLASRWLTPLFQSSSRTLGLLRDLGFRAARHIGPLRRRMTRTMAGVDRGVVFARALPIPKAGLLRAPR